MDFGTFGFDKKGPARTQGGNTYSNDPDGSRMREEWRRHADSSTHRDGAAGASRNARRQ